MARWAMLLPALPLVAGLSLSASVSVEPVDLSCGSIHCSAVVPENDLWFLGTDFGVFRSLPGRSGWEFLSSDLPRELVGCFHAVPGAPGQIYVALHQCDGGLGVYRSTSGGDSWSWRGAGLGNLIVRAMTSDPLDPLVLHAATSGGVYRSTDAGELWELCGLAGESVEEIAADPGGSGRIWCAVGGVGVYRSTDGGNTFLESSSGMAGVPFLNDIKASASGDTVYAVGNDPYRSTDGGGTWTDMKAGVLPYYGWITELAILSRDSRHLLVGHVEDELYESTDAGLSWTALDQTFPALTLTAGDAGSGRVLAGTETGPVFRSSDSGSSWSEDEEGLVTGPVEAIGLCGGRWLVGSIQSVHVSADEGGTWERRLLGDPELPAVSVYGIAGAPGDTSTAFCAGETAIWSGFLSRTTDAGESWTTVLSPQNSLYAVAVDPMNPDYVYAAGFEIYLSGDGGDHWQQRTPVSVGFFALAVLPGAEGVVLAGTGAGVLRSTDHGDTWSPQGPAGETVQGFAEDPVNPDQVYAYTGSRTIYRSTDAGVSWLLYGQGGLPSIRALSAGIRPSGLTAATDDGLWMEEGGVWTRLPDEEQPWFPLTTALASLTEPGRFLVGSSRAGLWLYRLDAAAVPEEVSAPAVGLTILGSPSGGPIIVRAHWDEGSPCLLQIFNAAGRLVWSASDGGSFERGLQWRWDGEDAHGRPVPSGLFLARFQSGKSLAAGRICLVR